MTCSLVLMDQTATNGIVDGRHCNAVSLGRGVFFACVQGVDDILNGGAQGGPTAGVVLAAFFRLTGALQGLR